MKKVTVEELQPGIWYICTKWNYLFKFAYIITKKAGRWSTEVHFHEYVRDGQYVKQDNYISNPECFSEMYIASTDDIRKYIPDYTPPMEQYEIF